MRLRAASLILLPLVVVAACGRPQGTRTQYHDSRTFAAAPGKQVLLDLRSLDAVVEVASGDSIVVDVSLEAHSSSRAAARRWVERNTPEMNDSPARLEVRVPRRSSVSVFGFMATDGTVRVALPAQCTLEVRTASGDVELSGREQLAAPVRVETTSGDVTIRGAAREAVLETASGDIRLTGAPLDVLEAETASGDVRLDAGAAKAVIDTASGDVSLRNLSGDLSASTSSGDVDARWSRLPDGRRISVQTTSGGVTLRVPAGLTLAGEARTTSGRIESEFPGEEDRRGRRFTLTGSAPAERPGQTEQAAATVEVTVRTTSGSVQLLKSNVEI